MPWTPDRPADFTTFKPTDFLRFLAWWELQHVNAVSLLLVDAFVDGVVQPYLERLEQGEPMPLWLESLLRYRLLAQWSYQVGAPLADAVARGIAAILPFTELEGLPDAYRLSPVDVAEIPPQVRQGFLEGAKFSLSWVTRLSDDARSQIRGLIAVNQLKNRSPGAVVPILEQVLRRDTVGMDATPEQVQQWVEAAEFKVLKAIGRRADLIAKTESMRMMNMGILTSLEQLGQTLCYVMPHRGTCPLCRRLVDGKVFPIKTLKQNLFANFGVQQSAMVPAMPVHPACRHSPMEPPFQFRNALQTYGDVPEQGLLLQWFGLPSGKAAMDSLGLVQSEPWLTREGAIERPAVSIGG